MPALHVVARPVASPRAPKPPESRPSIALWVAGENLCEQVAPERVSDFLLDVGYALLSLVNASHHGVSVSMQSAVEPWELGLRRSGADVLVSTFVSGSSPRTRTFESKVPLLQLRDLVLEALLSSVHAPEQAPRGALRSALSRLRSFEPDQTDEPQYTSLRADRKAAHLSLAVTARVQRHVVAKGVSGRVERADLHALLLPGTLHLRSSGNSLVVESCQVFLDLERLVTVAQDMLRAERTQQPLFRRTQLSRCRLTVRRGPGKSPLELGFALLEAHTDGRSTLGASVPAQSFVRTIAKVGADLCKGIGLADDVQLYNLRLTALVDRCRELLDAVQQPRNDELADRTNPEPETYQRFAPRRKRANRNWEQRANMRFVPRWVATVPGLDLAATFLCGDRLIVGGARETACIDRHTGDMLWKRTLRQAASVVTPSGLVRIEPDGKLSCHNLDSGEVVFTCRVTPRASGGTSGSVLYGGGLPKLLALAEGDRQVSGVDLTSGEIKWRYTAPRAASFKVRRAGKLFIVAGGDSRAVGLDGATGHLVWSFNAQRPLTGDVVFDHDAAFALSGAAGSIYGLHRFNPWSGKLEWSIELDERPRPPLLSETTVLVPTFDTDGHGVVAFDRATGERVWEHAPGLLSAPASWLVVDDVLLANCASGVLLGLDITTGAVRYNHVFAHASDCDQPRRLEPVLRSGALFVPQSNVTIVRPADGEILGSVPSDLVPDLIRVDERCDVYIAEASGHLAAFGAAARLSVVKR
jgi:outer membrane protein assembly factor BamB